MVQINQYYGSPFEKFAKNFCYKNHWRVQHVLGYDIEDFQAQCALWWVQCYNFYQDTVHDDALLMFMFKQWVSGQVHDLSRKDTKTRDVYKYQSEPTTVNDATLTLKLDSASDELKQVLKIFIDAPKEIMEVLRQDCQSSCPKTFFRRVIKYLGLDEKKAPQLSKELQSLLG